jgi:hypothetical protein
MIVEDHDMPDRFFAFGGGSRRDHEDSFLPQRCVIGQSVGSNPHHSLLKRSKTDISQNVKCSACRERSFGDLCDDERLSGNNQCPEISRDQENEWAEDCESNCDARNYRPGKLLIGWDRHGLRTQVPASGIELVGRSQLGLRSLGITCIAAT